MRSDVHSLRRVMIGLLLTVIWVYTTATVAFGQAAGVYVDADGVLRARESASKPAARSALQRRAVQQDSAGLVYVSLPRLFGQVRQHVESSQSLTDEMRYLGGMTRVRYVFVFETPPDLVIAGDADEIDATDSHRPRGARTGRPLLQLDDLVTVLRALGPNQRQRSYGCSIDLTQAALDRMVATVRAAGAIRASQRRPLAEKMVAAMGPQQVRIWGVEPRSRFAFTCLEADYLLKRLSLGLDRPPVRGVRSHLDLAQRGEPIYNRFWFHSDYEPIRVTPDGLCYEIRGHSIRVSASGQINDDAAAAAAGAQQFADLVTAHIDDLGAAVPAFADLQNVVDLSLVGALIGYDRLHERAGWDPAWVLDPAGYPVATHAVPTTAQTLVNYKPISGAVRFAAGGVNIRIESTIERGARLVEDNAALRNLVQRPGDEQWMVIQEPRVSGQ